MFTRGDQTDIRRPEGDDTTSGRTKRTTHGGPSAARPPARRPARASPSGERAPLPYPKKEDHRVTFTPIRGPALSRTPHKTAVKLPPPPKNFNKINILG